MKSRVWQVISAAVIFVMLVSMACSFGSPAATTEAPKPTTAVVPQTDVEATKPAAPTDEPSGDKTGAVASLEDVQSAVIQIQAEGTFIDPQVGLVVNGGGRGSGFIVSPDGIAITNNHVVTGAALLKVWIGGDTRKTYNAKVLGVSECSDLAVIDIDGGGFPFLEWQSKDPKVTEPVYSAGFPLGEPEYSVTDGTISKINADGETSWASVDSVLGHSARINPGNSGGPLVNADGQVVGVNYAAIADADQSFAISKTEADSVLADLMNGNDVNSIGVNGQAVMNEDGSISGIWVSSVASGSPADKAGVEAGDIITQMEDMVLATDGTMSDYCDILRTHDREDTLSLTVLRWSSQEILSGQLNGDKLTVSVTLGNDISSDVDSTDTTTTYSGYTTVTNDSGDIQIAIPNEWTDIDGSDWEATWTLTNGQQADFSAWSIAASADLSAYNSGWDESGVFFAASPDMGKIGGYLQLLYDTRTSGWYENDCTKQPSGKPTDYVDELYEGAFDLWENCGPNDTAVLMLVARPIDSSTNFLVLVEMKIAKEADLDALSNILATFQVN